MNYSSFSVTFMCYRCKKKCFSTQGSKRVWFGRYQRRICPQCVENLKKKE